MRKVFRSTSALILALAHAATGQVVTQQPPQQPQGPRDANYQQNPPPAAPQPTYEGHSLMRSSLARQVDPTTVSLREASWFAVPEPEPRVMRKHDLITIIVRQESESASNGSTDVKKEATLDASIDEWFKLNNLDLSGGGVSPPVPSAKIDAEREFKGEGSAQRRDRMTTRITAEIIDIKPNETLVLQATSRMKSDDEEVEIVVSGTCRIEDVSLDNTVLSSVMADLNVEKRTKGAVRDGTKRGLFPRLLDFLNPF